MTENVETATENPKESLKQQLIQQREEQGQEKEKLEGFDNAVQEQKADEVHVRKHAENSERLDSRSKEGEEAEDSEEQEEVEKVNKYRFRKGDEDIEVDEDAEFELKADGKKRTVTLRELKDYAAGGIAVRNRMRQLAEQKHKIQEPFKNFSKNSENDALGTLKKVFYAIKEVDPQADYKTFLRSLGNQVKEQAQMSPSERRSYELEQELKEKEERLSDSERLAKINELQATVQDQYDINEDQVRTFAANILKDPQLKQTVRNEEDLFERVAEMADEVQRQQASIDALQSIDKKISSRDPLVLELSQVLKKNPDFDSDDLKDIAKEVLNGVERTRASQKLSRKQRSRAIKRKDSSEVDYSKMSTKERLKQQILKKRQEKSNTR